MSSWDSGYNGGSANAILTDFQQSAVGARNAALFLSLYDCKGLSESYRHNRKKKKAETQRRFIPGTSTSVLFGATFNACQFRNQAVRIGLQRRFNYYVSEKHGRFIKRPNPRPDEMNQLASQFALLTELKGPFRLTTGADRLFSNNYQSKNRKQLDVADRLDEALCSRLSTAPNSTY